MTLYSDLLWITNKELLLFFFTVTFTVTLVVTDILTVIVVVE